MTEPDPFKRKPHSHRNWLDGSAGFAVPAQR